MSNQISSNQELGRCPSEFTLERLRVRELDGSHAGNALAAHVALCASCASRLSELSMPPPAFPLDQVWHAARGGPRSPATYTRLRHWRQILGRRLALPFVGATMMTAAAVALFWPSAIVTQDLAKGGPWGFTVLVKRQDQQQVVRMASGAHLSPGDRLRFEVSTSWPVGYAAIVSLDSAGVVSMLAPAAGRAVEIRRGPPVLLKDAVELDQTMGPERIDLVGCPQPIAVATLAAAARQALARQEGNLRQVGAFASGCHQETVWIEKRRAER